MSVVTLKAKDHSAAGMVQHLQRDKPIGGILITRCPDGSFEWRYYGDVTVVEISGAMEMVQHDLHSMDREQSR